MEFSEAKALITVDGARRKGRTAAIKAQVDEEMSDLEGLETIIVVQATKAECEMQEGRDFWFHELMEQADDECPAEPLDAEHPLFILYTSGSTAKPKGILHTTGGYLTQVAYTHKAVFDLHPDEDVYFCSADVGLDHRPLLHRLRPAGQRRDLRHVRGRARLSRQGHLVGAVRALRRDDLLHRADRHPGLHQVGARARRQARPVQAPRCSGTVGEPINPKAWLWYWKVVGGGRCPIVDTWWQTETGAIMVTTLPAIQAAKPGSAGKPLPGIKADVVTEENEDAGTEQGYLTLQRPWPSMLRTLYKEEDRFIETYWSKFGKEIYAVGDAARKDEDGYFWIIGRIDDVLNVSGHRMSTAEIESAIVSYSKVAEAAVIGQADEDTGQSVTAFVTLEGDEEGDDALVNDIREHVAKRIGKLARPKRIIWADDLPKTRSGKIMRRLLRDIAEGRELGDVTTLRDPDVMGQLEDKVKQEQAAEG